MDLKALDAAQQALTGARKRKVAAMLNLLKANSPEKRKAFQAEMLEASEDENTANVDIVLARMTCYNGGGKEF